MKKWTRHSPSFRLAVVRARLTGKIPVRILVKELGLDQSLIHKWVNRYKEDGGKISFFCNRKTKALSKRQVRLLKIAKDNKK